MANPQQPELARSRKTPHQDQDSVSAVVEGQRELGADAPSGPVPADNQPGHHPAKEQDKPDLDAFAERLGIVEAGERTEESASAPATASAPVSGASPKGRSAVALIAAAIAATLAAVGLVVLKRRQRR